MSFSADVANCIVKLLVEIWNKKLAPGHLHDFLQAFPPGYIACLWAMEGINDGWSVSGEASVTIRTTSDHFHRTTSWPCMYFFTTTGHTKNHQVE